MICTGRSARADLHGPPPCALSAPIYDPAAVLCARCTKWCHPGGIGSNSSHIVRWTHNAAAASQIRALDAH